MLSPKLTMAPPQFDTYANLIMQAEKLLDEAKYPEATNIIETILSEIEGNNTLDGVLVKVLCVFSLSRNIIRDDVANIKKHKETLIKNYSDVLILLRKRSEDFKKVERYDEYARRISNIYSQRAVVFLYAAGKVETFAEAANLDYGITDHVRGLKICTQSDIKNFHIEELNKVAKSFKLPLMPVDLTHAAIDQWHDKVQGQIKERARQLETKFNDKIKSIQQVLKQKFLTKKIESVPISLDAVHETAIEAINSKQFETAIKDLIFLLQLCDKSKDNKFKLNKIEATLLLAYCYKSLNKIDETVKKYRSALDQLASMQEKKTYWHSFMWVIQLDCGLAYLHHQDFKNALKEFKNSVSAVGYFKIKESNAINNPCQTLREIGETLIESAKKAIMNKLYHDAISYLTMLIDLNKKPQEKLNEILIYQLLAEAHICLLQESKAHHYLEKVLALDASVGKKLKEKMHQIKLGTTEIKPLVLDKKITEKTEIIIEPGIALMRIKTAKSELSSIEQIDYLEEKRKRRIEIQKEKIERAARQKKEEIEKRRLEFLVVMEEEKRKKIAEVKRHDAEKRAAKLAKKQQKNAETIPQPLSLKKIQLQKKMEERKQKELKRAERRKALLILKKAELKPQIHKKPKIKKVKQENITENRIEVIREKVIEKHIKQPFDKEKIEKLIAIEAQTTKRIMVIQNNEEKKPTVDLKAKVTIKKIDPLNHLSEHLNMQDIALVMRTDIGQIHELIQSNELLRSLLALDRAIQLDPILKMYNIQLTFEGTSIFVFIMAYYQGIKIDFIVNDLDLFIYNMPYKTLANPLFLLSPEQQMANAANARLQEILASFGFVPYNSKKHFSNYKKEDIAIELTVRHKNFKSTDPFHFTCAQAFFLQTGELYFIDRYGYIRVIARTNILDCDLITKDTPYIVKFFPRLLKYYEKIILSPYFKLGPNIKKMLTKEWQVAFFISKFRQHNDSSKTAAEHFNYLELASVIKEGYLLKDHAFPLTFKHAVILLNSFCEAVYFQYLEHSKARYSPIFSAKMADILLQYYNDCPQNGDFLYHDIQYLLKKHPVFLSKTVSEGVKLLQLKNQPYQNLKKSTTVSAAPENKVLPMTLFFSASNNNPIPQTEYDLSTVKSIKYSSNTH